MAVITGLLVIEMKRYVRNAHNFITPVVTIMLIMFIASLEPPTSPLGLLWICTFLFFLLNTDQLFRMDYHNGILEQYFFATISPYFIVLIKSIIFACFNTIILLFINLPIIILVLQPPIDQIGLFLLTLGAVVPSLAMLVALGSSYALAASSGFMPALISLPFYVPLVMLAMLAGNDPSYYISLLVALALLYIALLSWAIQFLLKSLAAV